MHRGRLLSSLHLTSTTSTSHLHREAELAGINPLSGSPQGFTASTPPFIATGPTPVPTIRIATSESSTAGPSSTTVGFSGKERVDGVYKKLPKSHDPAADGSNSRSSNVSLIFRLYDEQEPCFSCIVLKFLYLLRDWLSILLHLSSPWKRSTASQREYSSDINDDGKLSKDIPRYILNYAPLVHLSSNEQFWPCDIAEHLLHVKPHLNYTTLKTGLEPLNLTNLNQLNKWDKGWHLYLQSKDNVERRPKWLLGRENIPSDLKSEYPEAYRSDLGRTVHREQETLRRKTNLGSIEYGHDDTEIHAGPEDFNRAGRILGGRSHAPATLIVVPKEDDIVDAFWFFFYSYNLGNQVIVRFGNHVADWEYTLVRFEKGKPKAVYYSEHFFGQAYTYEAVEKIGNRPVTYSAIGTHAMYASAGIHRYILPLGLLHDTTDRGPLWDPSRNVRMYTYDHDSNQLSPGNFTPNAPIEWFYYNGHWGDKSYRLSDPRQYMFAGQYHYVDGPLGPRFKNLGRHGICEHYKQRCIVKDRIDEDQIRRWPGTEEVKVGQKTHEEVWK